jgi:hypothetical protein
MSWSMRMVEGRLERGRAPKGNKCVLTHETTTGRIWVEVKGQRLELTRVEALDIADALMAYSQDAPRNDVERRSRRDDTILLPWAEEPKARQPRGR